MVGTRPQRKLEKSSLGQEYTQDCKMLYQVKAEKRKRAKDNARKKRSRDNIAEKSTNKATSSKKKTLAKKKTLTKKVVLKKKKSVEKTGKKKN